MRSAKPGNHLKRKCFDLSSNSLNLFLKKTYQGAKEIIFTACHSGKLKLAFTSPDVISTSPKNFLSSVIQIPHKTSLARQAS